MRAEDALRQTFKNGNYYDGPVSALVDRLAVVREQLSVLDKLPGRMAAHRARQKRIMVGKFERAIRTRVSWHHAELRRAEEAGFAVAEEFEPRKRTIKVGANAHA